MNQIFSPQLRAAFLAAGRQLQTTRVGDDHSIVDNRFGVALRAYIQIMYSHKNIAEAVVNPVEFQRAGAVAIPWDPVTKRVAVVRTDRPIVPYELVDTYRALWEKYLGGKDPEARDVIGFGAAVAPLLGDKHWQLTQSYGYPPETIRQTAKRAAEMQAGMKMLGLRFVGRSYTDSSNRGDPVDFFLATVDPKVRAASLKPDAHLCDKKWLNERQFLQFSIRKQNGVPTAFAHSAYTFMKARKIW